MVRLNVLDKGYLNFSSYEINLKYNAIASTFSFQVLNPVLDDLFDFPRCEILKDDLPILTGTILIPELKSSAKPELARISGYSVAGVLEDVEIPTDLYPLQSDNLSLEEVAEKYTNPFDVNLAYTQNIETDMKAKYTKITADEGQNIKSFLNELASQKGIILTHNELGSLVFTRLEVDKLTPAAQFVDGSEGIKNMSLAINGQALHSKIVVIRQASTKNPDAGQSEIDNPYCNIYRPKTIILNTADVFDTGKAARKALSDELVNIKLTINTTEFVKPGNIISVKSDNLRIKKFTDFFVEECVITGNKVDENYTLSCVLKDVYSDGAVANIFN